MAKINQKEERTEGQPMGTPAEVAAGKKGVRGEICTIDGRQYFIKAPKARDMIKLEKEFQKHNSVFAQGLLLVAQQCDELTFEELQDMYVDDLEEVFAVFEKLMNLKSVTTNAAAGAAG